MRRRLSNPEGLPPCVYRKHGAYWLVKGGKWTMLAKDRTEALAEYARRTSGNKAAGSFPAFCDASYEAMKGGWKPNTAATYDQARKALNKGFAEFHVEQIARRHVFAMMEALKDRPAQANRNRTFLSLVLARAVQLEIIESNPCRDVKPLSEPVRDRELSPAEFRAIYSQAGPQLQVIMDLLYLTDQRISDVLAIRLAHLTDAGIYFAPQKINKRGRAVRDLIVAWTPDLRAVADRAKALAKAGSVAAISDYLLRRDAPHQRHLPPRYNAILKAWRAACEAAGVEDANLHDIRARAATDVQAQAGNAKAILMHTSEATTRGYLRGLPAPVVNGPKRVLDRGSGN